MRPDEKAEELSSRKKKATINKKPEIPSRTMEEFDKWRMAITVIAGGLIFLITLTATIFGGPIVGLSVLIALSTLFISDSFVYADAGEFKKPIPMVWGQFVNKLLDPGWLYLPVKTLIPFLLSYKLMNGKDIDCTFTVEEYLPKKKSKISMRNNLYLIIDPNNPVKLIEIGGLPEVFERLQQQMGQRERIWISSEEEGPQDVGQAIGMKDEALHAILRMIFKDDLSRLAPDIPDELILKFINRHELSAKEKELMAERWDPKDPAEKEKILKAGEDLLTLIRETRDGESSIVLHSLGVIITRFGIDEIAPVGPTAEYMNEVNKASYEAEKAADRGQGLC